MIAAYVGSGLQLFIMAAMLAWLPSFLNRYYDLPTNKAGVGAAAPPAPSPSTRRSPPSMAW